MYVYCSYKYTLTYVPVFPDVGSIMVSPGFSNPLFSASSTMRRATLSFTDPPALKNSHFATIYTCKGQREIQSTFISSDVQYYCHIVI